MKNLNTVKLAVSLVSLCFVPIALADAQTLGTIATNVTSTMGQIAKLITAASYVAGIAFALLGMFKFKAHKDNPTQTPLSQPIVFLAISAGLVFLPSLIGTAGGTIFGRSARQASSSGYGMENLDG